MNKDEYVRLAHLQGKTVYVYENLKTGSEYLRPFPIIKGSVLESKYKLLETIKPNSNER